MAFTGIGYIWLLIRIIDLPKPGLEKEDREKFFISSRRLWKEEIEKQK